MRYLIVSILLILFVGACTPQQRINRILRNHPELSKTKTDVERYSLNIPKEDVKSDFQLADVDSARYDSLLALYVEAVNSKKDVQPPSSTMTTTLYREAMLKKQREIDRLKKQIVSEVRPDTTFVIAQTQSFVFGDSTFQVRTDVIINLTDNKLSHHYHRAPIIIPYDKTTNTTNIDARIGKPFYKDVWFWLFIIVLAILGFVGWYTLRSLDAVLPL